MLLFPIGDLLDERRCYDVLLQVLHPTGLACPIGHPLPPGQAPHDRHRVPIVDYRCRACGAVFNLFTDTLWSKSHYPCSTIVLILRGIAQGTPTKHLAAELGIDRGHLLERRHAIQAQLEQHLSPSLLLPDAVVEADELYQNAGEKGIPHPDPLDPPRRRANKRRGHGTFANDRPPIAGVVGRESGHIHLQVCQHSDRATLEAFVTTHTHRATIVNTDEWRAYAHLPETGRPHRTVCHAPGVREWARDDDGDGVREVHCNTMEGMWTGCRNFLRPFRGVSKWFLSQYAAVFEWSHNLKEVTAAFLRAMMVPFTSEPT